jgi:hypothetical protein
MMHLEPRFLLDSFIRSSHLIALLGIPTSRRYLSEMRLSLLYGLFMFRGYN